MYTVLALTNEVILAAPATGEGLATALRNFIAPLFLFAISIVAMTFLVQRQMTQFFQFAAIAVGVAVFFYVPGIVEGLARLIAGALA